MPSPVGHSLIGLAIGSAVLLRPCPPRRLALELWRLRWPLLGCIVLASLPDLDYLPGILSGELNRYHHHDTHTLGFGAAALAGLAVLARTRGPGRGRRFLLLGLLLLLSHLAADMLTRDGSEPFGIMALWPLSEQRMISPVSLFPAFRKDELAEVFQPVNLRPVFLELLWCGGALALVWWARTRRAGRGPGTKGA